MTRPLLSRSLPLACSLCALFAAGAAHGQEARLPPLPQAAPPVPLTAPIYDPTGGPDLRNLWRPDLAQCSLWYGGPAGTLVPDGPQSAALPPPGIHGMAAAGMSSACKRFEALAQGSMAKDGAFVRGSVYRETVGSYRDGAGNLIPYGFNRWVYGGGVGFTRADGSFITLDATRAEKHDILYAGAPMDTRHFDSASLALRGQAMLDHAVLRSVRFAAGWIDFGRQNDNFSYRPLVGAKTLAEFGRQLATAAVALDGGAGRFGWTLGADLRSDHRDATRYQGSTLAAQSPVVPDGTVTVVGLTADGRFALAPDRRIAAGVRLDLVRASIAGMDDSGYVTSGFGATPTPRALYRQTYGYTGEGDASEANIGGYLRFEQDFDARAGRIFAALKRVVRTADPRERYFISFTPPSGQTLDPGSIHRTWIGNPALRPEQHHIAETGFGWTRGGWELAARAYGDRASDFILWDRAQGQPGITRTDNINVFRNVEAFIAGLEGRMRHRWENGLWLGADVWATYGQNLTDARPIAQIPPLEAALRAGWAGEQIEVETRLRLVATQTRADDWFRAGSGVDGTGLAPGSGSTPGFATVDAWLTWKPRPNARVTVGVENIFDARYREHIERNDIDDPFTFNPVAAGRSFTLRTSVRF